MAFARVGTQNIEEIRESGHRSGFVCLLVAEVTPVFIASPAVSPYQLDIVLRQGESGGKKLYWEGQGSTKATSQAKVLGIDLQLHLQDILGQTW